MNKFKNKFILIGITLFSTNIFSQSAQEFDKIKKEYDRLGKTKIKSIDAAGAEDASIDKRINSKEIILTKYGKELMISDSLSKLSKFFGYDFFSKRDTIKFWENLPTPVNYFLGPGDQLVVSLWGETQLRKTYNISREGTIYDDKVGLLNISGKNIRDAKKYLTNQFSKVYSTLRGTKPSSFMDVSLGELQSINVNFVGELQYPGVHVLHPFSNIITGLIQAGGIDTTASLRKIQIKRINQKPINIDLYNYLLNGDIPNNIQLRDQDIVIVPVRKNTISIDSSVVRPGIYESIKGENLLQLIEYAGGFLPTASTKISLSRIKPISLRVKNEPITENYYITYNELNKVFAQNGDKIIVQSLFKELRYVEIIGQVKRPGKYHYNKGMNIKNLIDLSGGLNDDTFTTSIYKEQSELVRRNPNNRYENVITINLNEVINNGPDAKIELQNLDRYVVHANLNFFERDNIFIEGEVNVPGAYPLISDNETLESIIYRSGNLTSKALKDGISIYRNEKYYSNYVIDDIEKKEVLNKRIRVAWKNKQVIMMPGDSVVVKESTKTINVIGEVYNPGIIEFQEGKNLSFYINSAGGITVNGDKKNIIVIYANGLVSPDRLLWSPRINDGSTIVVNKKEMISPFNLTEFVSNWTSLVTTIITAALLTQQLQN